MRCSKRSPGVDGWPPDPSDLTLDHATESIPVKFNFIACTVGHSEEPVVDERVVVFSQSTLQSSIDNRRFRVR